MVVISDDEDSAVPEAVNGVDSEDSMEWDAASSSSSDEIDWSALMEEDEAEEDSSPSA